MKNNTVSGAGPPCGDALCPEQVAGVLLQPGARLLPGLPLVLPQPQYSVRNQVRYRIIYLIIL